MDCKAAVVQGTKKSIDLEKDNNIYIMGEGKDAKAYRKCSKKASGCDFCHSHTHQENPILFSYVLENGVRLEKDHPFLKKIGNGGRKPKKGVIVLKESSYIQKMLAHGTPDRKKLLEMIAEFIFRLGENEESKLSKLKIAIHKNAWTYDSDTEKDSSKEESVSFLSQSYPKEEFLFSNTTDPSFVSSSDALSGADLEIQLKDILSLEDVETSEKCYVDEENSESENENAEDEIECEEIQSKTGETFYLDCNTMKVYNQEQEEIGILFEVNKKFHHIEYQNRFYTVVTEEADVYTCIFSNKPVQSPKPKKASGKK
jgi:hypothetical protein